MKTPHTLLAGLCLSLASLAAQAQCPQTNTAFQSGERLEYKLFFNWKFVWVNAGTATMTINRATHQGQPAYRGHLITRTSKRLDKFFSMRDTLESLVTTNIVPLYYCKRASEGGKYRINEVRYRYQGGSTHMDMLYQNPAGEITQTTIIRDECIYDMMSMMMRARSFKGSDFKVGQKIEFPMADGRRVGQETLIYRGIKNFTTEDTKVTYRCMVFSFVEYKGKKEKEIITFYITDDENHTPVRLDMFLKFGVAKAYLTTAHGLRNPETAILKK